MSLELACAAIFEGSSRNASRFVSAIAGAPSSIALHGALVFMSQLPASRQKATGIAGLILASDPLGIALLGQQYRTLSADDVFGVIRGPLAAWRGSDYASVATIGAIITDPNADISLVVSGGRSLSAIHTAQTIPYLAKLFDVAKPEVQIEAIYGIVEFIQGYPPETPENVKSGLSAAQTPTVYSDDPSWRAYVPTRNAGGAEVDQDVQFWRGWLKKHPALM
jgi:hypothetical protein